MMQRFTQFFFHSNSQLISQAFLTCIHFLSNFVRFDFLTYLDCFCTNASGIGCCIKTFQLLSLRKTYFREKKRAQDTLSIIHSEIMTEKRQREQSKSPDKQILAVSSCNFFFFLLCKRAGDLEVLLLLRRLSWYASSS